MSEAESGNNDADSQDTRQKIMAADDDLLPGIRDHSQMPNAAVRGRRDDVSHREGEAEQTSSTRWSSYLQWDD